MTKSSLVVGCASLAANVNFGYLEQVGRKRMAPTKTKMKWIVATDKPQRRERDTQELECACGNKSFRVLKEPIRRKEKPRKSPDLRMTAECSNPERGKDKCISLGGPN